MRNRMKSSIGEISFEHTTIDDKLIIVTATVHFDTFGEPRLDIVEIEDENGKEIEWLSLDFKDRDRIDQKACFDCSPQDECYDEYEDYT